MGATCIWELHVYGSIRDSAASAAAASITAVEIMRRTADRHASMASTRMRRSPAAGELQMAACTCAGIRMCVCVYVRMVCEAYRRWMRSWVQHVCVHVYVCMCMCVHMCVEAEVEALDGHLNPPAVEGLGASLPLTEGLEQLKKASTAHLPPPILSAARVRAQLCLPATQARQVRLGSRSLLEANRATVPCTPAGPSVGVGGEGSAQEAAARLRGEHLSK